MEALDREVAARLLREGMLKNDLSLKEAAARIARSVGTVKRALKGSMGPRTAYRIRMEFGSAAH